MLDIDPLLAETLWRKAELSWLLRPWQDDLYDLTWSFLRGQHDSRKLYVDCHRRYGKSFVLFTVATEVGLGKAPEVWADTKRIIRFSAPSMLDLEEIYHPIAEDLFESCPDDLRPVWRTTRGRGHYYFPSTGSQLYLFGVDAKHYKKARGKKVHLAVPDEIGACEPGHPGGIEHVVNSIIMPQTFGCNGRIVMPTTPPETPGHSSELLRAQCEAAGSYVKRSIFETAEKLQRYFGENIVEEYAREAGGRETTTFRREYGCEHIVDEAKAAVPEFNAHEKAIVQPFERPEWFIPLVSMDPGFGDWHAILFGYWNFERATLDIEDESYHQRTTTDPIAKAIRSKEDALWPWAAREMERDEDDVWIVDPWREQRRNPRRWSDTDLRLIADLGKDHGIGFMPTPKDEKEVQVNELRRFVADERVRIHPRCKDLIRDLKTTIWDNARRGWERTADGHHGDGVDALIYMLRNAPRSVNPVPPKYANADRIKYFVPDVDESEKAGAWAAVFGRASDE